MSRKHWSEQYACHVCGKRHRSYMEDARHRHNFPYLCKAAKKVKKKVEKSVDNPSRIS